MSQLLKGGIPVRLVFTNISMEARGDGSIVSLDLPIQHRVVFGHRRASYTYYVRNGIPKLGE